MAVSARQALLDHSLKKLEPTGPVIPYAEPGRSQLAPHQLNVFTDRTAADLAAEKFGRPAMGTYVAGVPGPELFGHLLEIPALAPALMLQVNPGSSLETQWFIQKEAFGLCAAWASAISLERAISTNHSGWAEAMRSYQGWLAVLGKADNALVRMNVRDKGEQALIFTAPDLADRFLNGLPNAGGAACKTSAVAGQHLFKFVMKSGAKGFIVNPGSPQPKMFDASVCRQILGLPPG
ncbi:MAG: hypothetical protein H6Q89_550 [Myxococcaceae bacterium]|nr:hypothetical protein [Myxococcaceae bacterium]